MSLAGPSSSTTTGIPPAAFSRLCRNDVERTPAALVATRMPDASAVALPLLTGSPCANHRVARW
ncbi:hypothetical protein A8W25_29635 [Streptomyces sp. ERV7]|uniref:hypothetical protein n=1 Tax=Streptomyces sp. ERV7 TaxID=1322334 RepID=UPI0007F35B03|nr:hypothetical protein [Streptomyces sp. ERV7]OAR22131.1 hypothetical protein A8W25_29635 [Streptomyces sp. ERV7]